MPAPENRFPFIRRITLRAGLKRKWILFLFAVADQFARKSAAVDAGEAPDLKLGQKGSVRNFAEMVGNEPNVLLRSHPIVSIETPEIDRPRIAPKGAFPSKIEVGVKVTERQFPKVTIDRFAVSAAGEIRLRDRAPVAADLKYRDDVVGIAIGFQIEKKRWITEDAEGGGGKNCTLEAMRGLLAQHYPRGPGGRSKMIGDVIEESLHTNRALESTQSAELSGRKHRSKCGSGRYLMSGFPWR